MIDGGEAAQTLGYVTKNSLSCVLFYTLPALTKGTLGCDCDCVKADGLGCIILPKKLAWRRMVWFQLVESGGCAQKDTSFQSKPVILKANMAYFCCLES
jgi:hypothetical protein